MAVAQPIESCELARQVAHDLRRVGPSVDRLCTTTTELKTEVALLRQERQTAAALCAQNGQPRCALAGRVQEVARTAKGTRAAAVWMLDRLLPLAAVVIALLALLSRSPAPARPEPPPAVAAPATIPITAAAPPAAPGRSP